MDREYKITTIDNNQEWIRLFNNCRITDLMQTWAYGESVDRCIEWQPIRQVVLKDQQPVAITQTFLKDVPVLGKVARMQHGPMFTEPFISQHAIGAMEALHHHWVQGQHAILHITPCLFPGELPEAWDKATGFHPSNEILWRSVRIDLAQPAEKIYKNFKRRWRNPLRKAESAGLKIDISQSDKSFSMFLEKYKQSTTELGISWPSPDLVKALWAEARADIRLLFAVNNNEAVSAMLLFVYADTSYSFAAWNGPRSTELHSHNFLIWHSILHHQQQGYRWLDLGGIDPENLPGITSFKRGTRGDEYQFIGNFEAHPAGVIDKLSRYPLRQGLGHILPGLELPESEEIDDAADNEEMISVRVQAIITEFIEKTLHINIDVDGNLSLINSGLIDSLSIVTIIQALQHAFHIEISPQDITVNNFDTVQSISQFVQEKRADNEF